MELPNWSVPSALAQGGLEALGHSQSHVPDGLQFPTELASLLSPGLPESKNPSGLSDSPWTVAPALAGPLAQTYLPFSWAGPQDVFLLRWSAQSPFLPHHPMVLGCFHMH